MNRRISPTKRRSVLILLITLTLGLLLSGCTTLVDYEASQEYISQQIGLVNQFTTIGQEILVRQYGVNGITVWLSQADQSKDVAGGHLTLSIYENVNSTTPIFTITKHIASITQNTPTQFDFLPLEMEGDTIYIELSTSDTELGVNGRQEDTYPDGSAYQSRLPINGDIAFRTSYFYNWNTLKFDLQNIFNHFDIILSLIAAFIIPGYAVFRLLQLNKNFTILQQAPIIIGLSLAITPIIYLFGTYIGYSITLPQIRIIILASVIIIISMWFIDGSYKSILHKSKNPLARIILPRHTKNQILQFCILIGIFTLTIIIRLVMARDLVTPAWVDSYHHGLLTRIILRDGMLPQTYNPYLQIEPTSYHPGFHAGLAFFIELSGLDIPRGMLIYGQVLNAVVILSVFLLTEKVTRSTSAGLFAALIAGTFTAMPAYYTSWGRYPQLAGLVLLSLPIAMIFPLEENVNLRSKLGRLVGIIIALAGLCLVHYRVTAFLAGFLLVAILTDLLVSHQNRMRILINIFANLILPIIIAGILISGWLIPAIRFTFIPRIAPVAYSGNAPFFSDFSWNYLTPALGKQAIVLAIIGGLWAILKKQRVAVIIPGWVTILLLLANLNALHLPGGNFINTSSVTIMLFMPISIMGGYLIDQLSQMWKSILNNKSNWLFSLCLALIIFAASIYASHQLITILNPTTILTRNMDKTAIAWIDNNIPDDQVILINPFTWGYGLYASADGGGWIPTLAGNPTIPPPVLYGLGQRDDIDYYNRISQEVIRLGNSPEDLWIYLKTIRIHYIYIGARGGSIFPSCLVESNHFEAAYNEGNTWVLHVLP